MLWIFLVVSLQNCKQSFTWAFHNDSVHHQSHCIFVSDILFIILVSQNYLLQM